MNTDKELLYNIAMASYRNMTRGAVNRFAEHGITPELFFEQDAHALAAATGVKTEFFDKSRRTAALRSAETEAGFISANKIKAIFASDGNYPQRLRECDDAPAMLYTLGDADADCTHVISIVGTRHATAYGIDFTARLVKDLAEALGPENLLIVSGLAYGIDVAAHRAALSAGTPTTAVLAHGLNTIYPADHRATATQIVRDGGSLLTEYRSTDAIHRGNFLARNRIVAGLADVTVVVESAVKGGALSTARMASAYNREVMALPGRVSDTYSCGCNALIADNVAMMLRDAGDLIDAMGWQRCPAEGTQTELPIELSDDQRAVLDLIERRPEATVNDMCVALSMPYSRLSALLFEMEMDDLIIPVPGGRYTSSAKL